MSESVKRKRLTDIKVSMKVRAGVEEKSLRVIDGQIVGRWSKVSRDLDDKRLREAVEYLVNARTLDDHVVASFIRRFGITLNVPHGRKRADLFGYPFDFEFPKSDDFADTWEGTSEGPSASDSWIGFQEMLRKVWRLRTSMGQIVDSIPVEIELSAGDKLVPDKYGNFTLQLGMPRAALLACLRTIPLGHFRVCANEDCKETPLFIADRERRKYCSDTCFRRGLEEAKTRYETKKRPPKTKTKVVKAKKR